MNIPIALLAPLALLFPTLGTLQWLPAAPALLPAAAPAPPAPGEGIDPAEVPVAEQVRIEQRVIVRVSPLGAATRQALVSEIAPVDPPRLVERKMGKCLPVAGIAAVQPDASNTLLLFMRDRRLISASLEKACSARDFYSGFYLERTGDGMLCVSRDKLHSRAGASCAIGRLRQLVSDGD
jgi:hypothetical protein